MNRLRCLVVGVTGVLLLAADGQGGTGKDKGGKVGKDGTKKLDGLWVLETSEEFGRESSGTNSNEAIRIEAKTITWTNRAGDAGGGQTADVTAFDRSGELKKIDLK